MKDSGVQLGYRCSCVGGKGADWGMKDSSVQVFLCLWKRGRLGYWGKNNNNNNNNNRNLADTFI